MQEHRYDELENRASLAEHFDEVRTLETRTRVKDEIQRMRESGEALTLTDEEERMLWSFRRFKLRMRKNGEVFKWQTAKPEGVVLTEDTVLIVDPSEVQV
jgi:hypothetical protein